MLCPWLRSVRTRPVSLAVSEGRAAATYTEERAAKLALGCGHELAATDLDAAPGAR